MTTYHSLVGHVTNSLGDTGYLINMRTSRKYILIAAYLRLMVLTKNEPATQCQMGVYTFTTF